MPHLQTAPLASMPEDPLETALRARLDARQLEIPLLPHVAAQVIAMTQAPDVDAARLAALIHGDQAIAGHVLRVANSVVFAGAIKIVSLQQAITRLGTQRLSDIVSSVVIRGRLFSTDGLGEGFEALTHALWRHALCVGLYAREIARARRCNVESGFLCGLLHDVGKPVLLLTLSDVARRVGGELSLRRAQRLLDAYHAEAGAALTRAWELPEPVIAAAAHHHDPASAAAAHAEVVWTVALANALAHSLTAAPEARNVDALMAHPAAARLNLYPEEIEALVEAWDGIYEQMDAMAQH